MNITLCSQLSLLLKFNDISDLQRLRRPSHCHLDYREKGTGCNLELGRVSVGKFSPRFNKFKRLHVMRSGIVQLAHTVLAPVRIIH